MKMDEHKLFHTIIKQLFGFCIACKITSISDQKSLHKFIKSKSVDCPTRVLKNYICYILTNKRILVKNNYSAKKAQLVQKFVTSIGQ